MTAKSIQVRTRIPMWLACTVLGYAIVCVLVPCIVLPLAYFDQKNVIDNMLVEQKAVLETYGPPIFQGGNVLTPDGEVNTAVAGNSTALLEEFYDAVEPLLDPSRKETSHVPREYV